ncbi:SMAD/FHA domain-containing protein, partial [Neoconidiobolus thromboides FSU 785]
KVNFGLSGLLTKETNTFRGVVIKYNEPPDAIQPKNKYRWYVYKGDKEIDMLPLHRQSAYLIGRDRKVADIPLDHESISKQHAVLQYRKVKGVDPNTNKSQSMIKPYIIDLDSANGTFVNDIQIPATRYFELKSKDIIKFGGSTRDYVFIQDESE